MEFKLKTFKLKAFNLKAFKNVEMAAYSER
jgi:hypothetical protein